MHTSKAQVDNSIGRGVYSIHNRRDANHPTFLTRVRAGNDIINTATGALRLGQVRFYGWTYRTCKAQILRSKIQTFGVFSTIAQSMLRPCSLQACLVDQNDPGQNTLQEAEDSSPTLPMFYGSSCKPGSQQSRALIQCPIQLS